MKAINTEDEKQKFVNNLVEDYQSNKITIHDAIGVAFGAGMELQKDISPDKRSNIKRRQDEFQQRYDLEQRQSNIRYSALEMLKAPSYIPKHKNEILNLKHIIENAKIFEGLIAEMIN